LSLLEKHYSVPEIAEAWGLGVDTVRDLFKNRPGVFKIERPETRFKRGYTVLRVPETLMRKVYLEHLNR
jgi:hypothetical protein